MVQISRVYDRFLPPRWQTNYINININENAPSNQSKPAENQDKFSLYKFGENMGKGALKPVHKTINDFAEKPIQTGLKTAATIGVSALCPPVGYVLAGAAALEAGKNIASGTKSAATSFMNGKPKEAEKAGENIGEGGYKAISLLF